MKTLLFLIALTCAASAVGQTSDERIATLLKNLEPDNTLRLSLEHGARGNGIHHAWMDAMKGYGIKQAAFVVQFTWDDGIGKLKISRVDYLQRYYRYDTTIHDPKVLKQIRVSGLERDLRAAIIGRANETVPALMDNVAQTAGVRPHRAHGTLYLNLLDDESLPILDTMPTVEW
jgi:hypothetical protein